MFVLLLLSCLFFFFFHDTATTEIYTLSLHDALPISVQKLRLVLIDGHSLVYRAFFALPSLTDREGRVVNEGSAKKRSEEHTSELQSLTNLVCRLLLEKKNKKE